MPKVVETRGKFKIVATKRDYVVINTTLPYEHHAHFKSIQPLYKLLKLVDQGILPHSPYMLKAAKRLLGDDFYFLTPKHKKENYKNHHRRAKVMQH